MDFGGGGGTTTADTVQLYNCGAISGSVVSDLTIYRIPETATTLDNKLGVVPRVIPRMSKAGPNGISKLVEVEENDEEKEEWFDATDNFTKVYTSLDHLNAGSQRPSNSHKPGFAETK